MSFSTLGLSQTLLHALAEQHYEQPYPIQTQAIPAIISKKDVLGIANTGSGKTLSYVLPVLMNLEGNVSKENRHGNILAMKHLTEPDRQAYFECWLAIASPDGLKKCVRGVCEGTIADQEKGGKGSGYDSLFIKYEYGKTFAELEEAVKNRISHRRKALDKLHLYLESITNALLDRRI